MNPDELQDLLVARYARAIGLSSAPFLDVLWTPPAQQDATVAAMLGIDVDRLAQLRDGFRAEVDEAAAALLRDAAFAPHVAALPFASGDRIVVVGDSISADAVGWASILEAVLRRAVPGVELVNRAVAGRTTAETLYNLPFAAPFEPTHALVMLGTDDTRRIGSRVGARMASIEETERNLGLIRRLLIEQLGVRSVTLVTPPPVDPRPVAERRAAGEWNLPEDIEEVAAVVRRVDPGAIDVLAGLDPDDDFFDVDGLHPTPAGQIAVARTVIAQLAGSSSIR